MAQNAPSSETYDVVVVGGGPAGVETALEAGSNNLKTLVVADMPIGGRATYGSLLPSKVWLHTAESAVTGAAAAGQAAGRGAAGENITGAERTNGGAGPDLAPLRERIQHLQKERTAQLSAALRNLGVEVVSGTARLLDRRRVRVRTAGGTGGEAPHGAADSGTAAGAAPDGVEVTAKAIVITSGSEPRFFPNVKPDGDRMIAPRHTQKLEGIPETMIMVGGGVTGCEYATAFQKMGTKVHLITDIDRLLPRTDPELAESLRRYMEGIGIQLTFNSPIKSVENTGTDVVTTTADGTTHRTDFTFIATGRRPDDSFLEEAEERPEQDDGGWLKVDGVGRTSLDGVYAAGDIAGAPLTANQAHTVARRIVRDIRGEAQSDTAPTLIEAVYTDPQVVHIGPVVDLAAGTVPGVTEVRRAYDDTLLGRIHQNGHGGTEQYIKIWVDAHGRAIRGAAAFGESAVDILAPIQLAMEHGIPYPALRETPLAHPALSEVLTL